MNKKPAVNNLYMAGGVFSGLTSQTLRPLSCGSDTISSRNPARPHTSDRCVAKKKRPYHYENKIIDNNSDNSDFRIFTD